MVAPIALERCADFFTSSIVFSGGSAKVFAVTRSLGLTIDADGRAELGDATLVQGRGIAAEKQRFATARSSHRRRSRPTAANIFGSSSRNSSRSL